MFQLVGYLYCLQFSRSWSVGLPLTSYFLSLGEKGCPDIIWNVVCRSGADAANSNDEDDVTVSGCFLLLIQEFDSAIQKLENESATLISRVRSQLILHCADFMVVNKASIPKSKCKRANVVCNTGRQLL